MPLTAIQIQRAREVHERVGRNVIRIQFLEIALKTLVPFVDLQGAKHALDGLPERCAKVTKVTLGQLVGAFQGSVTSDSVDFNELLDQVVEDRNDLVHHFPAKFGSLSRTEDEHAHLLRHLDEQFELVKALETLVHSLMLEALKVLRDSRSTAEQYREFADIHDEFKISLERWTGNVYKGP